MRRAFDILASPALLLALLGAWITYYVVMATWSREVFGYYMIALGKQPLYQAPFVLVLVSSALNLWRALRALRARGWQMLALWAVLPVGIWIFTLGFFMSATMRTHTWGLVGEGQEVVLPWSQDKATVTRITSPFSGEVIDIESAEGIFSYEPRVTILAGQAEVEVGAFPPRLIGSTYFHLLDFGFAPGVRLIGPRGVVSEGYVMQKLLPPGAVDVLEFPPLPYKIDMQLMPSRELVKGQTKARAYDMDNLRYNVTVHKAGKVIAQGDSARGPVEFEGYRLEFFAPSRWVWLEMARNPGLPVLTLGLAIMLIGLPMWLAHALVRILQALKPHP